MDIAKCASLVEMFSYCCHPTDNKRSYCRTPITHNVFQNETSPQVRRKTAKETDLIPDSLHYTKRRSVQPTEEKKKKKKKEKKKRKEKRSGDQDHCGMKRRHNKVYLQSSVNKRYRLIGLYHADSVPTELTINGIGL